MYNALSFTLLVSLLVIFSGHITVHGSSLNNSCTYCVSNPKASNELIQSKLDFCCGQIPDSCEKIQPGAECYVEHDRKKTASYVFNDWFLGGAECDFDGTEIRVTDDPSFGDCKFKCR